MAGLPASLQGKTLDFFPETPEIIETAGQWTQGWQGAIWTAAVPIAKHRASSPEVMPLVLAGHVGQERLGFVTQARVSGEWPADAPTAVAGATNAALNPTGLGPSANAPLSLPTSLWVAL
ncbi:MAG TPA: protein-disulfide reductase, partial [Rhodoferax sp.]|nr:protein-disulfide reductase [Rhodoferax sp.]